MQGWQVNKKGTCAQSVEDRAIPETEIPPVYTGGIYYTKKPHNQYYVVI